MDSSILITIGTSLVSAIIGGFVPCIVLISQMKNDIVWIRRNIDKIESDVDKLWASIENIQRQRLETLAKNTQQRSA